MKRTATVSVFVRAGLVWKSVKRSALTVAFACCIAAATLTDGLAQSPPKRDTFSAKTVNLSVGSGQDLKIDVFRWSTDEERNVLLGLLKDNNDKALAEAIQKAPSLGNMWTNEGLGYTIRYAYRDVLGNGSERVILVTDNRFGAWSGQLWKPLRAAETADYPFSVIELRFNGTSGEGKMSLTSKITADETGKTIALDAYDAAPVLLRSVKREPGPSK